MARLLTTREAERVLGFINARWYKHMSPDVDVYRNHSGHEFFSGIDKGYGIKLIGDVEGITIYDYTNGTTEQRFMDFVMKCTLLKVDAVVEDSYIYMHWQGKKRALLHYTPRRKVPAAKTVARVIELFRMNAGTPSFVDIEINWL